MQTLTALAKLMANVWVPLEARGQSYSERGEGRVRTLGRGFPARGQC